MADSLIDKVRKKATYFGTLTASEDYTTFFFTSFYTNEKDKCHEYYKKFGDCVYFLSDSKILTDESTKKIGMAGGISGWYSRFKTYEKGVDGDQTNRFMLKEMKKLGIKTLYVYGLPAPRETILVKCPLTGDTVQIENRIARPMEAHYTELYLKEKSTNKLPLCKQHK